MFVKILQVSEKSKKYTRDGIFFVKSQAEAVSLITF